MGGHHDELREQSDSFQQLAVVVRGHRDVTCDVEDLEDRRRAESVEYVAA